MRRRPEYFSICKRFRNLGLWLQQLSFASVARAESLGQEAVETRLQGCGLEQRVSVLYSPVSRGGEYQIDPNQLRAHLGSKKVDWVIIDGPAGPDGCRASTLPSLAQFCRPGARWFLDDAYRDGELEVLNQWTGLTGVVVDGIYPIGKGLGTGLVTDPGNVGQPH